MSEVPVREMELNGLEPRVERALRGVREAQGQGVDLRDRERARREVTRIEGQRRGRDRRPPALFGGDRPSAVPGCQRGGLASRVRELDGGRAALTLDEARDRRQRGRVSVRP